MSGSLNGLGVGSREDVSGFKLMKEYIGGILVVFFLLLIYNFDTSIQLCKTAYLRHLKAKEDALIKEVIASFKVRCAAPENPTAQNIEPFLTCTDKQLQPGVEASAIHEKRLRLEVKWDHALPEDAKELGWTYPLAQWDGSKWVCPVGADPYVIEAEKQAGAEHARCLTKTEAAGREILQNDSHAMLK